MIGIDIELDYDEGECAPPEKELPDEILTLVKNAMIAEAGGDEEDKNFTGESDPWCNLIREIRVEAAGESKFNLCTFPTNFGYLRNLESLALSNHNFSSLPVNIAALDKLRALTIERTKLKSAAEIGSGCTNLIRLRLNDNKLTSASKSLHTLTNLEELNLRNNTIKDIYAEYANLKNLKILDLGQNRISKLHADLKQWTALQVLDISNNTLGSGLRNRAPLAAVPFMTGLTRLDVSNNKLSSIPPLNTLIQLESLNISGNLLTELPVLGALENLHSLRASNNQITNISLEAFTGVTNLRALDISYNKFKFFPNSVDNLVNLNELYLMGNRLSTIPDTIGKLVQLVLLDLSFNDFLVIQQGVFGALKSLKTIHLQNNRLSRIPSDIFSHPTLREVDLSSNTLGDLPNLTEPIPEETNLQRISLATNQLNSLPAWFSQYRNLRLLHLHENPVSTLPMEFCEITTLELFSVYNIIIHSHKDEVEIIKPEASTEEKEKKKKGDVEEAPPLAHIRFVLMLVRECPHDLLVFALAELAENRAYHSELQKNLDDFLYLLSKPNKSIVINAIRALGGMALNPPVRRVMIDTPVLLQTLLVLCHRTDPENTDVAVHALKTMSHLCLSDDVARQVYKQALQQLVEKESSHEHNGIREGCRKILNCIGYTGHLNKRLSHLSTKRGVRILCMDGGGTKSVSTVRILRDIERRCGKKIHELFDLVCGTSVGGILSCLFGIACLDSEEVNILQKRFFKEIFTSGANKAEGGWGEKVALLSNLFSTGGRYNTAVFEKILRELFGEESLIDTSSLEQVSRVFVAAVHMDVYPPDPYLFRNYTYAPGVQSRYPGNCERKVWEAIRATSAAPSMFSECVYDAMRFSDGGMAVNNPTGLAYHEYLKIWGRDTPLDCIVSIGTGAPVVKTQEKGIKDFVLSVIESATSVARVDDIMMDFLSPEVYYRFNVVDDAFDVILDETRDDKILAMEEATDAYVQANEVRLAKVAECLMRPGGVNGDNEQE